MFFGVRSSFNGVFPLIQIPYLLVLFGMLSGGEGSMCNSLRLVFLRFLLHTNVQ